MTVDGFGDGSTQFLINVGFISIWVWLVIKKFNKEIKTYKSGFYTAALMRGATPGSYVMGSFFSDFMDWFIVGLVWMAFYGLMGFSMPGLLLPVVLYAIAETIWVNFFI